MSINWNSIQGALNAVDFDNQIAAARARNLNPDHGKVVLPDSAVPGKDPFMRRLCIVYAWHSDKDARDRAYRTLVKTYPGKSGKKENIDPIAAILIDEFSNTPYPPNDFVEAHAILKVQWRPEADIRSQFQRAKPTPLSYEERLKLQHANPDNPLFNMELNDMVNHYMGAKTEQDKTATYDLIKSKYPGYAGENKDLSDDVAMVMNEYQRNAENEEMELGSVFTEGSFSSVPLVD